MGRIKMNVANVMTFYDGCEEYILDCKARNLRNGTLRHYTDSSKQIMKYIGEDTLIILDNLSEKCIIKITEPTTPLILSCATRWDFYIVPKKTKIT